MRLGGGIHGLDQAIAIHDEDSVRAALRHVAHQGLTAPERGNPENPIDSPPVEGPPRDEGQVPEGSEHPRRHVDQNR